MNWDELETVSLEEIEEAARGGYWGNTSETAFIVALNVVAIAASCRKKELSDYCRKNIGHSYYTPKSTRNPSYHFAGSYSDLLEIVAYITRLSPKQVENRLRKFSYNNSKFIHTWSFYSLPKPHQRVFHSGQGWKKDEDNHKFMWDYKQDGTLFHCTQSNLKYNLLMWDERRETHETNW